MTVVQIPTYEDLLWPTLKALENKGGSASNQELSEEIASYLELSDDVLDVLHNDGPLSKVEYRGAWARTHLKFIGAIDNTSRAVWTISEFGREIDSEDAV
jgi:restriction system protein